MAVTAEHLAQMPTSGTKYTNDERLAAARHYAVTGSYSRVHLITNIPAGTLHSWGQSEWWDSIINELRAEKAIEHRTRYSELVDKAQARALDTIDTASPKDAMLIACMGTDKIRLADNMPTSISANAGTAQLQALADQFAKLAGDHKRIQDSVVSTQAED